MVIPGAPLGAGKPLDCLLIKPEGVATFRAGQKNLSDVAGKGSLTDR